MRGLHIQERTDREGVTQSLTSVTGDSQELAEVSVHLRNTWESPTDFLGLQHQGGGDSQEVLQRLGLPTHCPAPPVWISKSYSVSLFGPL